MQELEKAITNAASAADLRDIITVAELAVFLRVSRASAYQVLREGIIPSCRIGRRIVISKLAVLTWVASGGAQP